MLLSDWEVGDIIREGLENDCEHFLILSKDDKKIFFYVFEENVYDTYFFSLFKGESVIKWTKMA
jgi:hypothetical protein